MAVLKKIFQNDIGEFGKFFFSSHLSLETPKFHKELYRDFQGDKKRIVRAAPRGHGKSTVVDLVYLAHAIVHGKTKFVLLVSDTYSQAALFLQSIKSEFEGNEALISFYGKLISTKWTEGEIVANNVLIKAIGAGMKVRGLKYLDSRPDLIVVDDLENDELVESLERREKLERWYNGALVPSLTEDGRVIVIGTILHYDSLLAKMLREDNYQEYDKKIYRVVMDGRPLWEEHLNLVAIEKKKQDFIAKGLGFQFFREYMNDPVSDENQKFKPETMKFYTDVSLAGKLLNNYITVDRAYSIEKTADFTGIIINSVDRENNWHIRLAERFKGTEKELIDRLFDIVSFWKPVKVGIEQKAFEYTLRGYLDDEMRRRNQFFKVVELKDLGKNKNLRIEGLVPRYESGSIYFLEDQLYLREELERFPRGDRDDLLDALAYQLVIAESPNSVVQSYSDIQEQENLDYKEW